MPVLGKLGAWGVSQHLPPAVARSLESFGYTAVWIGNSPAADLTVIEDLLAATDRLTVATGIVNIWTADAVPLAASFHRLEARYPGRFLLGVGAGHAEAIGARFSRPYGALAAYLDILDAEGVPAGARVLAALGPRTLALAAGRSAGAHPYLTTPDHTRTARDILGPDRLLAPEQKVVLGADAGANRALARQTVQYSLRLGNYQRNLRGMGFPDADLADGGSDRLVDALVARGDADAAAARVADHHRAGADHVAVQLLAPPETDQKDVLDGYRRIAAAVLA
jgi:probable F420-dependent oxidoreductase